MNIDEIKGLVKIVEASDIDSLEVRRWLRGGIRVTKTRQVSYQSEGVTSSAPSSNVPPENYAKISNKQRYVLIESKWDYGPNKDLVIGGFHLCKNHENPDPESEDRRIILSEGSRVNQGELLYYLDALTLSNPIVSPVTGTVVKILVEPGSVIQYGTKLFVIEKDMDQKP